MAITQLENGFIFVPRGDWDSSVDFPSGNVQRPVKKVFLHHTVTKATDDPCADARTVERILDARSLDGYSYLVHPSGVVLEFAGSRRGEHTGGHNSTSYAFSFIGNYDQQQATLVQLVNTARCLNLMRLKGDVHRDLGKVEILPHAAVKATACPGVNLRANVIHGRNTMQWIRWFAATGA